MFLARVRAASMAGERLAGCAPGKKRGSIGVPEVLKLLAGDGRNILLYEHPSDVSLKGVPARGVDIDACDNINRGFLEASGEAAGAAEQVDRGYLGTLHGADYSLWG